MVVFLFSLSLGEKRVEELAVAQKGAIEARRRASILSAVATGSQVHSVVAPTASGPNPGTPTSQIENTHFTMELLHVL